MRVIAILLCGLVALPAQTSNSFLIRNATVHPVTGPAIQNGSVLVRDGKIAGVGVKLTAPAGVRVIDAKGLHVYPGMINSQTQLGLSEIGSVRETVDTTELGQFNPQLRSLIAINPASEHIPVTRANGVTSVLVVPVGGGDRIITGQAALVRLNGWTWEEMNLKGETALNFNFPSLERRSFNMATMSTDTKPLDEVKREYEEKIRRISSFFEEARRYQTAKRSGAPLATDLKLEAMLPVLERNVPLLVNVDREQPIRDAIAWAEQQKVNVVLAGIRQPGKAVELLAQKKIPVILGETLSLPETEDAPYDEQYALPALLYKAGVKFAFGSFDNQFARNLPYQAANAVAYGLPMEAALRSITINAAEIWGVAKEIGSIEEGKSADLVLADGDLLSARTKVVNVFIKGQEAGTSSKHTELYEKYKGRK